LGGKGFLFWKLGRINLSVSRVAHSLGSGNIKRNSNKGMSIFIILFFFRVGEKEEADKNGHTLA